MKKIVLTERQAKQLMSKVIEEQVPAIPEPEENVVEVGDGRYKVECQFVLSADEYTPYKNGEIDDIGYGKGVISYSLEIDQQPYGIQNINVTDVEYPKTTQITIRYYPEGSSFDDEDWYEKRQEETVELPIDWSRATFNDWGDNNKYVPYLGVGKKIYLRVKPDGKGGLIAYADDVDVREFHGDSD
jgi:hypothetical protein